jgi:putative SOS response-associated peptidase YedK
MCGRFTYRLTWREIYELYRLTVPESPGRNLQARYNICPTTTIDVIFQRDPKAPIQIALDDVRCPRCNGHARTRIAGLSKYPSI